ncbi:MAG: hypothetical protein PVG32_08945 [Anaerolineales bacterium]|jgi:hypothetical protein
MTDRIEKLIKESYRYFYVDGLPELVTGVMFALTGAWLVLMAKVEQGTLAALLVALGLPLLLLGGVFLINRLLRSLKERITYPRTGFVSYRRESNTQRRRVVMVVAIMIIVASFFIPKEWNEMPLAVGGILGTVLILLGFQLGLKRFFFLGAFAVLLGIGTVIFLDEVLGSGVTFLGVGLAEILTGAVVLARYLGSHPKQGEV